MSKAADAGVLSIVATTAQQTALDPLSDRAQGPSPSDKAIPRSDRPWRRSDTHLDWEAPRVDALVLSRRYRM